MRALSIIDSFKGTMTSKRAGEIVQEELKKQSIDSDFIVVSDGGEGFLDAISSLIDYEKRDIEVLNPLGKKIHSYYLIDKKTNFAFIELALASGLNLIDRNELNPLYTSTYGVGELVKDAIKNGCPHINLGIGGSCTNDGGSGLLEALGVKFYDKNRKLLSFMTGEKLGLISAIDFEDFERNYEHVQFTTLCDVTNPLLGPKGATYTFGPQKGGTKEILEKLEENMNNYVRIVNKYKPNDFAAISGTGAAGGVSFATIAFFHSVLQRGLDFILDLARFDDLSKTYDIIITGEGQIDYQSLNGKVPLGVYQRAKGKPVVVLVGVNQLNEVDIEPYPNLYIFSIVPKFATIEESLANPQEKFRKLCQSIDFRKI